MQLNNPEQGNQSPTMATQGKAGMNPKVKGFAWIIGISFVFLLTVAMMFLSIVLNTSDFKNRNKH